MRNNYHLWGSLKYTTLAWQSVWLSQGEILRCQSDATRQTLYCLSSSEKGCEPLGLACILLPPIWLLECVDLFVWWKRKSKQTYEQCNKLFKIKLFISAFGRTTHEAPPGFGQQPPKAQKPIVRQRSYENMQASTQANGTVSKTHINTIWFYGAQLSHYSKVSLITHILVMVSNLIIWWDFIFY